jgi:hypothetical protein
LRGWRKPPFVFMVVFTAEGAEDAEIFFVVLDPVLGEEGQEFCLKIPLLVMFCLGFDIRDGLRQGSCGKMFWLPGDCTFLSANF